MFCVVKVVVYVLCGGICGGIGATLQVNRRELCLVQEKQTIVHI